MRLRIGTIWPRVAVAAAAALLAAPALAADKAKKPAAVVQAYQPKPALWLLSDADTRIYLFGTTHMLAPGFKWRSAALDKAAAEAGELVVETYQEPGKEHELSDAEILAVTLDAPRPVLERVPEDKRAALAAAIDKAKLSDLELSMMRTWMIAVMLEYAIQLERWGLDDLKDAPGVEDALEAQFRKAGKPIGSVEGPEAGLDAFNALSDEAQAELLIDTIAPSEGEAEAAEGEQRSDDLWAQGRYDEAYALEMADMPPVLFEGLLVKRNAAWTQWLQKRLEKPGTVLFAVGAAHLAGPQSVQTMLAARGLEAKRVD